MNDTNVAMESFTYVVGSLLQLKLWTFANRDYNDTLRRVFKAQPETSLIQYIFRLEKVDNFEIVYILQIFEIVLL